METSANVVRGNRELAVTMRRSKRARGGVAIALLVAALLLLLLDWLVG